MTYDDDVELHELGQTAAQFYVRLLLLILFLAGVMLAGIVFAQVPRAQSPSECAVFADLALVAGAAAKQGLAPKAVMAMALDMYVFKDAERFKAMAEAVIRGAYGFIARKGGEPKDFANALGQTCMSTGGDMTPFLGTSV